MMATASPPPTTALDGNSGSGNFGLIASLSLLLLAGLVFAGSRLVRRERE